MCSCLTSQPLYHVQGAPVQVPEQVHVHADQHQQRAPGAANHATGGGAHAAKTLRGGHAQEVFVQGKLVSCWRVGRHSASYVCLVCGFSHAPASIWS